MKFPLKTVDSLRQPEYNNIIMEEPIEIEKGKATEAQVEEVKEGKFYRIKELASDMGYSVAWITHLVQEGRIKGMKPTGGSWRIPASEVARMKKEGIPPLPRVPQPVEAREISVNEEHAKKILQKQEPQKEEKEEGEKEGKVNWPLNIFFK